MLNIFQRARQWIGGAGGAGAPVEPPVAKDDPATERKSYSLLPMDRGRVSLRGVGPRPGDRGLLQAYEENPWLNVKLIRVASSLAMMDFKVGTEDGDGAFSPLPKNYPLWVMLRKPNTYLTGFDFRFLTMLYSRCVGEVYWRVVRGGLAPAGLYIYPREWVNPIRSRHSNTIQEYEVRAQLIEGGGATVERVPATDMIWLRHPDPLDPYIRGIGEVLAVATELDTFELASESDRRFFENDAQPPGALIVPGSPTELERKRIIDDWQAKIAGPERQGSIPILSGGLDYKQFRQTRKEMDFIEGQQYLRDVIIRGVHKVILGLTDEVSFAAAKAGEAVFGRWELLPEVRWLEENINMFLAPKFDRRAVIKFESPVPTDETFELLKANEGLTRGALTRNQWLKTMGYPTIPPEKGDVYLLPFSVAEVPADSEPREMPLPANQNPVPDDNDEKLRPPGDQGARSVDLKVATEARPKAEGNYGPFRPPVQIDAIVRKQLVNSKVKQLSRAEIRAILAEIEDDDLIKQLLGAYEAIISARSEDAAGEVGATPAFDLSATLTQRYMAEEAAQRIVGINAATRRAVRSELEQSIAAGESLRAAADRLSIQFQEFKTDRAVMIARTETIDASRWSALETYKVHGVEGKEWLLAPDYDPEEDDGVCKEYEANGVIPISMTFHGPEGDLDGPTAHPGCRCAVAPVVAEESEDEEKLWRRFYDTVEKQALRRTALGREHERLERIFANAMKRSFQGQQNRILRRLRES